MRRTKYDLTSLEDIYYDILERGKFTNRDANDIRKELNMFFKDSRCEQVYYTDNTDKMFFGMKVFARMDPNMVEEYLMGEDDVRISSYVLELDSHLFDPTLGLNCKELVALTLHEVGHVVNDSTPVYNMRAYIDEYMAANKETLRMSDSIQYREILTFAMKDFISKQRSIFYTHDVDEVLADDFVRSYGYGDALESAMNTIIRNFKGLYTGNSKIDKFSVFMWTLGIYKHLGTRRIAAIRTLNRAKALTGSRLEKAEIENVIRKINRIDDSMLMSESSSKDPKVVYSIKRRMAKMRANTMRSLEDDYYELNMRIRNVEDEEDALYLMRQINTRIGLIDDYINSEDLSTQDVKRWTDTMDRFKRLRDELSSSLIYKNKSYGLYVAYPDIKENNY